MPSVTLHFRTTPETRDEIDQIAKELDRDRSWVINEAIDEYLTEQRRQIELIEEGDRAIAEGRYESLEQVREYFEQKFEAREKATKSKRRKSA